MQDLRVPTCDLEPIIGIEGAIRTGADQVDLGVEPVAGCRRGLEVEDVRMEPSAPYGVTVYDADMGHEHEDVVESIRENRITERSAASVERDLAIHVDLHVQRPRSVREPHLQGRLLDVKIPLR